MRSDGPHLGQNRARGGLGIAGLPDRAPHHDVIGARRDRAGRRFHPFLVPQIGTGGPDAGRDDQPGPGQGADRLRLARRTDDPVGTGIEGTGRSFDGDLMNVARLDHACIQIRTFQRGQDRHAENLEAGASSPLLCGMNDMRVAVNGQEIQIELCQPAHRGLDRGADVEQLHVQKDALSMFLLQFVRQGQPTSGQHAQPDLVEADGVAQLFGQCQPFKRVRHVQCHDQPVIHPCPRSP